MGEETENVIAAATVIEKCVFTHTRTVAGFLIFCNSDNNQTVDLLLNLMDFFFLHLFGHSVFSVSVCVCLCISLFVGKGVYQMLAFVSSHTPLCYLYRHVFSYFCVLT